MVLVCINTNMKPIETIDSIIKSLNNLKNDLVMYTYKPEHFKIQELVDRTTYEKRGEKAIELLDPYLLWTIDRLREQFGLISINTWSWGGSFEFSGFRPKNCSMGAYYSQHRLGRAFDLKFKDYTPDEIRTIIKENKNDSNFKYISCVELDTPTWVHIDSRPIEDKIRWINP